MRASTQPIQHLRRVTSWYFLIFTNFLVFILLIILFLNYLDQQFLVTSNLPTANPGQLTDKRFEKPLYWVAWITAGSALLAFTFSVLRASNTENLPLVTFQFLSSSLFAVVAITNLVYHSIEADACNNSPDDSPTGECNLCNDVFWCCVYGSQAPNSCPAFQTSFCTPNVTEGHLMWNQPFAISFSLSIFEIILAFALITFGCFVGKGYYILRHRQVRPDERGFL
jgi:hypothetical protein